MHSTSSTADVSATARFEDDIIDEAPGRLAVGLGIACLLAMIWGVDRGIDITDEGFYLLGLTSERPPAFPAQLAYVYLVRGWCTSSPWCNSDSSTYG